VVETKIIKIYSRFFGRLFPTAKKIAKFRKRLEERDCRLCINYKTMNCPNSALCMCTEHKPFFEPRDVYEI